MLPAAARLTNSADFRLVTRRGRRVGRSRLVVHAHVVQTTDAPRAGFVVTRAVGNSVVRHRVVRRLRHLVRDRLGTLPPGSSLIVRALPSAAGASSAELAKDLDAALLRLNLTASDDGGGR